MIICGVILKIKKNSLCVMTKNMDYVQIKYIPNTQVGQYIYFPDTDIINNKFPINLNTLKYLTAAAFIIVAFASIFLFKEYGTKTQTNTIKDFVLDKKAIVTKMDSIITPNPRTASNANSTNTDSAGNSTAGIKNIQPNETVFDVTEVTTIIEAEDCNYFGAQNKNILSGYYGKGYLEGFQGQDKYLSFSLKVSKKAQYDMWIRYSNINPGDDKDLVVNLNGRNLNEPINYVQNDYSNIWSHIDYELYLNQGLNTIKLQALSDNYILRIDSLKLIFAQ